MDAALAWTACCLRQLSRASIQTCPYYFLVIPIFPCDSATLHRILEGWNVYLVLGISLNFMFPRRTMLVFFNGAIIALRCANTCLNYCYSLFAIRMVHVTNVD